MSVRYRSLPWLAYARRLLDSLSHSVPQLT
jgi:hypothetical protein